MLVHGQSTKINKSAILKIGEYEQDSLKVNKEGKKWLKGIYRD